MNRTEQYDRAELVEALWGVYERGLKKDDTFHGGMRYAVYLLSHELGVPASCFTALKNMALSLDEI